MIYVHLIAHNSTLTSSEIWKSTKIGRFQKLTFENRIQNWPCTGPNQTKFGQKLSNTLKLKVTKAQYQGITLKVTGTKMRQGRYILQEIMNFQ